MERISKNEGVSDKQTIDQESLRSSLPDNHKVVVDYLNDEIDRAEIMGDLQKKDDLTRLVNHVLHKGKEQNESTQK